MCTYMARMVSISVSASISVFKRDASNFDWENNGFLFHHFGLKNTICKQYVDGGRGGDRTCWRGGQGKERDGERGKEGKDEEG